jgi:hypothetical protein
MTKVCEWDAVAKVQRERDMTPEEEARRAADMAAAALPAVPQKVTRRQALSALRISGVTAAMVETAIDELPVSDLEKDLALIEFRESLEFEYTRPLTVQMCIVMGLNRGDLFRLADTL